MSQTITLTKATLVKLLDELGYPQPDDPGPYGPIGPILRQAFRDLSWGLLSPQPLPPRTEPNPDPWEPHPDPWRLARLARALIDRVVGQYQLAEVLGGAKPPEKAVDTIRGYLRDVVDDWCGTRPPKWPWPWPPRSDRGRPRPVELLMAAAQFEKAAISDNPLRTDFSAVADQLFTTALKQLEGHCS